MKANGKLEQKQGFYFLPGRKEIIVTRLTRYNYAQRKLKRARRLARLWRFIPWIKMVAVGNLIGAHNLKDESDIDLFIIAAPGRVWLTRFFCAGLAAVLGLRPKPGQTKDKICLSFYVSEEALRVNNLLLPPAAGYGDIYFIYWLAGLVPIYDTGGIYEKFIKANRFWLKEYLPNWRLFKPAWPLIKTLPYFYCQIVDLFFGGLEKTIKKWQIKKLPSNIKKLMNKDTRVVVNDKIVKLHIIDRRNHYRREFIKFTTLLSG